MLKLISSMATRLLLVELATRWQSSAGVKVVIESVGGVQAAKRVRAGEAFDGVVLAADAIQTLVVDGHFLDGSRVDLLQSSVALAVKTGALLPDISTETALRKSVLAAPTIGYSTGPSGAALIKLFEQWGFGPQLQSRMVQAPPGMPVGELIARGQVALGFQQLSELIGFSGIAVVGTLPDAVAITTVFSAGVCRASAQPAETTRFFALMASPEVADVKRHHGMQPV